MLDELAIPFKQRLYIMYMYTHTCATPTDATHNCKMLHHHNRPLITCKQTYLQV